MEPSADDDTERLLKRIASGDLDARDRLLEKHRRRLRNVVSVRMDPRLAHRVDASDVVQEVLLEANGKLNQYLEQKPIPFYPWLRQFLWNRLVDLHRHHLAQKRDVSKEFQLQISNHSIGALAGKLAHQPLSVSYNLRREELNRRIHVVLEKLSERDREILILRYLEELDIAEIAGILNIEGEAAKKRQLRALMRIRQYLDESSGWKI